MDVNTHHTVVFSSDDAYAQHTGVAMCSLLENTSSPHAFEICIIDFNISHGNKENLTAVARQYGKNIRFVIIEDKVLENIEVRNRKHISKAAFGKILIPDLMEKSVDKVVFLDSDIIVKDDITKLFSIDISEHLLGAVMNPFFIRYQMLGIPGPECYFNSGVLLLNVHRLKEYQASAKVISFLIENKEKIEGAEQDALNAVLHHGWKRIHPRWNQQTSLFTRLAEAKNLYDRNTLYEALHNPAIIHFSSSSKPWQFINLHPLKHYYYVYLKKTPWKNYIPADKNLTNIIKMQVKSLIGYNETTQDKYRKLITRLRIAY